MTLAEFLQSSPAVFTGIVFVLGLLVGSFLNVVIHRLPLMMERDWRRQCAELATSDAASVGPGRESGKGITAGDAALQDPATGEPAPEEQGTAEPPTAEPATAEPATPPEPSAPGPEPRYNLIVPRSACPACNTPIEAWQNIPLVSYALLRGRCAACGVRISLRYPLVELLTGIFSAAVAWKFGFAWETVAALVFTWCLIALAGIDIDQQLLPDSITLPLLWMGLLLSLWYWGDTGLSFPVEPRDAIVGAVAGYLSLWSVYHLFRMLTGKEGMGYGDFKLFAAFGAWFGWKMLMPLILMAAFTGAVVGITLIVTRRHGRDVPISFGPYLAAAGWTMLIWGPQIIATYLGGWTR